MTLPKHPPTELAPATIEQLLDAACKAADAAAVVTCQYFRSDMQVENKAGEDAFDPVTQADRLAELAIREQLIQQFPDIGFYGEEHEVIVGSSDLMWVVDPIDGTRAFMSGMPLWGTLIGLYDGRNAVLGVMDQPILKERYIATNTSAQLHSSNKSQTLSTRTGLALDKAIMYCTTPDMFTTKIDRKRFELVRDQALLTRYGGDCYAYALLAAGFVDVVLDCDLAPYDIMALIPLIEAAGGVVSNWEGESAVDGGYVVASGSRQLHEEVLIMLRAH
ncbi:MAG: histidinol-phosphatase [Granulosicoccus sp.]